MPENEIARQIVDASFKIHKPGLLINVGDLLIKDGILRIANGL
jgi:hypothetical protein